MNSKRAYSTLTVFQRTLFEACYCFLSPSFCFPNPSKVSLPSQQIKPASSSVCSVVTQRCTGLSSELHLSRAARSFLSWLRPRMQLICQQRSHPWIMESDCSNGTCYKTPTDFKGADRQKPLCTYTREVIWDSKLISAVLASRVLEAILCSFPLHIFFFFAIKLVRMKPNFSQTAELCFVLGFPEEQMEPEFSLTPTWKQKLVHVCWKPCDSLQIWTQLGLWSLSVSTCLQVSLQKIHPAVVQG